jgi:hypothetical protein
MSTQPGRPAEKGRSTGRILLDIILIVAIPTILIYIVSRVWR